MVALDLDDAVLDRAAGAALLLERAADLFELRAGQRHAVDRAHALAATMGGLLPDADRGWPGAWFHVRSSSVIQRSVRSAIRVSSSTARSPSRRISSGATR